METERAGYNPKALDVTTLTTGIGKMHTGSGDSCKSMLLSRRDWHCIPGILNHKRLYTVGKTWFEFDGHAHCRACQLKGSRFSLIYFTSSCLGKSMSEPRTQARRGAAPLPHPDLRHNLVTGCGSESRGDAGDTHPSDGWLKLEVGEHPAILTMGERVAFRTTHRRSTQEFDTFPANFINPEV